MRLPSRSRPVYRLLLLAVGVLLFPAPARAVTVFWLESQVPEPSILERAEATTGEARHLAGPDLAFPPVEPDEGEQKAWDRLEQVLDSARQRWDAFDVERGIAWEIHEAISKIPLVRTAEQRELLVRALLWQGAAVYWSHSQQDLPHTAEGRAFLRDVEGEPALGPWIDALALSPEGEFVRSQLPDQTTFEAFLALERRCRGLSRSRLRLDRLPQGPVLVVDGRPVQRSGPVLEVSPGRHWVYLEEPDGSLRGAAEILVQPGTTHDLHGAAPRRALVEARGALLDRDPDRFPAEILEAAAKRSEGSSPEPIYFAAVAGLRRAVVLSRDQVASGEGMDPLVLSQVAVGTGLGVNRSDSFVESPGQVTNKADLLGRLAMDVAWRNLALVGRADLHLSGGKVEYGVPATETNATTGALLRLTAGPGLYLPRPRVHRTYLRLDLQWGTLSPGHAGSVLGFVVGIPTVRSRWVRVGASWFSGSAREGFEGTRMHQVGLSVGIAQPLG